MSDTPQASNQEPVSDVASATALTDQLAIAGQTLVFCDDTDIAEQPVATLQPDLRILVAVQMPSENYAALDATLTAALDQYGVQEFHATDIASGNHGWKGRSEEERASALTFVADQLATYGGRIGAVWLPKGQYPQIRKDAEKLGKVGVGFKHGLRRVLVRSVVERLATGTRPAMLWLDQDNPLAEPKVEHWPEATFLVGGGPVVAPSHLVRGLQLADLAAWSVQRYQIRRASFDDGAVTEIDKVAMSVVAAFPTGFDDLRGDAHRDWAP